MLSSSCEFNRHIGMLSSSYDSCEFYPSQAKNLEGGTKNEIRIFEALFMGVSTRFGLGNIEKSVENMDFIFCQSFQNLRLGSINSNDTSACYHPCYHHPYPFQTVPEIPESRFIVYAFKRRFPPV
jgi:hypothetical protein